MLLVVTLVPILGAVVSFLALIFGTGTLALQFYSMRRPVRAS